ncbi:MAG: hypothetical protein ABFD94_14905 [Armatimonadia bacterium]
MPSTIHRLSLAVAFLIGVVAVAWAQPQPAALVEEAHKEAMKLREPEQRAIALADIAVTWHRLGDARAIATLAEASEAASQVEEVVARPLTWRGLAVRAREVAPEQVSQLTERAVEAAGKLPYAAHRAMVLREIARAVDDPARARELFAQAATASREIAAPVFRAAALRDLAGAMAATDPAGAAAMFKEAADAVVAVPDTDETAGLARQELVTAWSLVDVEQAMREAAVITDERLREVAYRRMCQALSEANPDAAMQVVTKLKDPGQRALAMAAIAAHLPASQAEMAAAMARAALGLGADLPSEERGRLEADVAVAMASVDPPGALAMLTKVDDQEAAGRAVGRIALLLAPTQPRQASQLLAAVEDFEVREDYQAQLAPVVAKTDTASGLELARGLLSRRHKVRALLAIAEQAGSAKQE